MEINIGGEYKLNIANAKNPYIVLKQEGDTYTVRSAKEAHSRLAIAASFIEPTQKPPKESTVKFRHEHLSKFGELLGIECWDVIVHEFPTGERRGRKPSNA